jgi:hypothetical protein
MKRLSVITFLLLICAAASSESFAQRKAVSGAEVTGTFRSYFTDEQFKDSYSEILIQALGGNKLKVEMKLIRPYQVTENVSVNVGHTTGAAVIQGDTAVFESEDSTADDPCKFKLEFVKPGTLVVTTENKRGCYFGQGVDADGTYKKTSGAVPKFGEAILGYVAPAGRKAVSGAEVTGTFRSYFRGKFKGSYNEILIQALGGNKLKIKMDLVYPYQVNGEMTANLGTASGEAVIQGDTAVFTPGDAADALCKITLKFSRPGTLIVTTENNINCSFGHNVSADGTYKKTSGARPKFEAN